MPSFSLRTLLTSLDRKRFKRLATEGSWILGDQISTMLGAAVTVRVLTDLLSPTEYGKLALVMTVASLITQTVMAGVTPGIGRFYAIAAEKKDLPGYLKAAWQLMSYATLAVCVIGIVAIVGMVAKGRTDLILITLVVVVFSVLGGFKYAVNSMQTAARQRALVAIHGGIDAWLEIGFAVLMVTLFGGSGTSVLIGYSICTLLVSLSQFFFLKRRLKTEVEGHTGGAQNHWSRQIWLYSWPMMAGGVFNWAYFSSQRWALQLFASTDEVGKFFALTQVAYSPIILASGMFMTFLTPILFARAGDPKNVERVQDVHQFVVRTTIAGLCITFFSALTAFFFHKPIFSLFAAPAYQDISLYMPLVVMAAGILVVSQQLAMTIFVKNETKRLLTQSLFGNGLATLLNLAFTAKWGVPGLMISMVLGSLIHLTWTTVIVLRSNRERNFSDVSR